MALNVFGSPSNMTYSGTGTSGDPYVIESTNHSVNTTGVIVFEATEAGTIFPNLTVDSEIASDVAGLFRNAIPIWQASGQDSFSTSFHVVANNQITVNYIKDSSGSFGDDNVTGNIYFVADPPTPLPEVAIVIVTQPTSNLSGSVLLTQPSVKIVDVNGDIVPGTLISVTAEAVVVSGVAVASGTLTIAPVSGNVDFTDLIVTGYGSYYLLFTAAGLTSASSNTITFVQDPGNPNPPIPVKPKRSYISASVPTSGDMETNEFAINVTDKKGYVRDSNGIVHLIFDGNPSASGVSSIIAGTGVSVDTATGDVTVTNSEPDQIVSITSGTGINVTGTYPDFTIDSNITQYTDSDARLSLSAGTGISYDNATGIITNSEPDQIVSLADGTGISVTGTYPSFTIDSNITQYTDSDARLSLSAGTGISYDNTTGIITNSAPDQTVSLTEGTDITITGTYPDFTIAYSGIAGGVTSIIAGTGISVDVSTGAVTVTNSEPDQTVTLTNGTGISVTGTYPSFTIATTITQYTDTDARKSISSTATGLTYTNTTGVFSTTSGYGIPTTSSQTNWDTTYTNRITSLTTTGSGAATLVSNVLNIPTPSAATFTSLTVTGSSGASTLSSGVLNVPTYTLSGLGGQASSTNLTSLSGLTYVSSSFVKMTAAGTFSLDTTAYGTGSVTSVAALTLGTTGTDLSSTVATGTTTPVITLNVPTASATNRGALSSDDWSKFNTAYTDRITSLTTTGSSGSATLTTNTLNVPTYTLAGLGGIKLTDLSSSATGLTYTNTTGAFSLTSGYSIPTTAKQGNWDTAYSSYLQWDGGATSLVAATGRTSLGASTVGANLFTLTNPSAITFPRFNLDNTVTALNAADFRTAIGAGTSSTTGTVTSVAALTLGTTGTDVSSTVATGTTTPVITLNIPTASATNRGALSSSDFTNFNTAYTNRITSLTTTGSSGAATLTSNTLNIPTYTLAGLGGIKLADLSSTATGLTYTNTTGVFSATSGYSIPTTSSQTTWDTAYTNRITSLTTTGSSGSATLTTNTLNIPTYTLAGLGGQASSASLTSLAGLTYVSASFVKMTAANTFSLDTSTYLTANQTITLSGDISGSGTTAITTTLATVPITKGGTGQTTANAAVNALLPSQTSNSGKYLTTDGTNSSWGTVSSGTTIPSASMQMFAGAITQSASAGVVTTTAPTGWLLCNGNAVSRTTYAGLFAALGSTATPYGYDATTFNLPDMRSRVPLGVGTGSGLTARTLGGTVGTETETLTSSQIPAHSHPNTVGSTAGGTNQATAGVNGSLAHAHNLNESVGRMALGWSGSGGSYAGGVVGNQPQAGATLYAANSTALDHTHNLFITNANNTGGGGSHNNMQPSIGLNYIIKT